MVKESFHKSNIASACRRLHVADNVYMSLSTSRRRHVEDDLWSASDTCRRRHVESVDRPLVDSCPCLRDNCFDRLCTL